MDTIIIWLAKQLAAYAVSCLAKKLGVTDAAEHLGGLMLQHNIPLKPDPLPSPAAQRKPKQYTDD